MRKDKEKMHAVTFFLILFWAARLPAVAVGLSALLATLVPAPIPAACGAYQLTADGADGGEVPLQSQQSNEMVLAT